MDDAQCVDGVPADIPRIARNDHYFVLRLWNYHHALMRGQASEHLNALLRRTGLVDAALRVLKSGNMQHRLLAIMTLGNLREEHLLHTFRQLADDSSPFISLAAAQALLQADPVASLPWRAHCSDGPRP